MKDDFGQLLLRFEQNKLPLAIKLLHLRFAIVKTPDAFLTNLDCLLGSTYESEACRFEAVEILYKLHKLIHQNNSSAQLFNNDNKERAKDYFRTQLTDHTNEPTYKKETRAYLSEKNQPQVIWRYKLKLSSNEQPECIRFLLRCGDLKSDSFDILTENQWINLATNRVNDLIKSDILPLRCALELTTNERNNIASNYEQLRHKKMDISGVLEENSSASLILNGYDPIYCVNAL